MSNQSSNLVVEAVFIKFIIFGNIMIPGPNLIYKCPKCKKTVYRGSLRSGNTLGAKLFSDGKRIAPMLPEFPFIVKCKECNTFFWLNDKNKIGKYSRWFNFGKKWKNPDAAEFLSPDEYFEAIKSKIYKNKNEELRLRLNLWRAFNDRTREGKDIFLAKEDKDIYIKLLLGMTLLAFVECAYNKLVARKPITQ